MNKYLEKIAAKVELEPGVNYDLAKHDIAVSRQRMSEHLDSKDKLHRGVHGAVYASLGGTIGYGFASQKIKNDNYLAQPTVESVTHKPTAADLGKWLDNKPKTMRMTAQDWVDNRMPDAIDVQAHKDWLNSKPRTALRNVFTPGANNLVGRLAGKYGIGKVLTTGKALGGLTGAAAIGGLGYFAGGLEDTAKADYKNSYLHHLEKKHDAKINELEGWG